MNIHSRSTPPLQPSAASSSPNKKVDASSAPAAGPSTEAAASTEGPVGTAEELVVAERVVAAVVAEGRGSSPSELVAKGAGEGGSFRAEG